MNTVEIIGKTLRFTGRCVGALALVVGAGWSTPALGDIAFSDFSSSSGLSMVGVAARTGTTVTLTPSAERVAGAVWNQAKQGIAGGFETTFQFRISEVAGTGADGIAFVIQNASPLALGGTGGGMGYADNVYFSQMGVPNSVAVEFDTWDNSAHDWPDMPANHVSVHTRGMLPNSPSEEYSIGSAMAAGPLDDGAVHSARIDYSPGTLRVFLDGGEMPLVTAPLMLGSAMTLGEDGRAWVGFTSATGGATDVERHEVLNWTFTERNVPTPGAAALLLAGGVFIGTARKRRS